MRIDFNFISDIPILVAMQYFSTLTLDVLFVLLCIYFSLLTYLLLSLMSAFPYFILMELLILTKCNFLFLHRNIIALQNKNSLMTYAASADSDQPAHSCSLIRVHTSHLNLKHSVCKSWSWWLSWMPVRLVIRRSQVWYPPDPATSFRGDWSWNIF